MAAEKSGKAKRTGLFRFFMLGVFLAERAVFVQSQSVGIVLLILNTVVISVFAFRAFKRDFGSCRFGCHIETPYKKITPSLKVRSYILAYKKRLVNSFSGGFAEFDEKIFRKYGKKGQGDR